MNQMNQMYPMNQMNQMNQMNNLNNINNMGQIYNQNNISPPMKGIKNYSISTGESSYANSALQSFACLDCIKNWFNRIDNNIIMNNVNSLTYEFYQLLKSLYSQMQVDSTNIINRFYDKGLSVWNKNIKKDLYRFIYYFLELIHLENNNPMNPSYDASIINNQSIDNMRNHDYMYNLFGSYFQQTQNSIISQCFYNIHL